MEPQPPRLKPEKSLTLWVLCKKPDTCSRRIAQYILAFPDGDTVIYCRFVARHTGRRSHDLFAFVALGYKGFQDF